MSPEPQAGAALHHLACLIVAATELRTELASVTHPTPGISLLASFEDAVAKAEQHWLEVWQGARETGR